jgi:hypothetical protein
VTVAIDTIGRDPSEDRVLNELVRAIDERGRAIWERLEAVRMVLSELEAAFDAAPSPGGNATSTVELAQEEVICK